MTTKYLYNDLKRFRNFWSKVTLGGKGKYVLEVLDDRAFRVLHFVTPHAAGRYLLKVWGSGGRARCVRTVDLSYIFLTAKQDIRQGNVWFVKGDWDESAYDKLQAAQDFYEKHRLAITGLGPAKRVAYIPTGGGA